MRARRVTHSAAVTAFRLRQPLPVDAEQPAAPGVLNLGGRWWRSPEADPGSFRWVMQRASRAHWNGHPRLREYVTRLCLVWAAGNPQRAAWAVSRVLEAAESWSHSKRDFGRGCGTRFRPGCCGAHLEAREVGPEAEDAGQDPQRDRFGDGCQCAQRVPLPRRPRTRDPARPNGCGETSSHASQQHGENGARPGVSSTRDSNVVPQTSYISTKDREGYVTWFTVRTGDGETKTVKVPAPLRPEVEAARIAELRKQAAYLRTLKDP